MKKLLFYISLLNCFASPALSFPTDTDEVAGSFYYDTVNGHCQIFAYYMDVEPGPWTDSKTAYVRLRLADTGESVHRYAGGTAWFSYADATGYLFSSPDGPITIDLIEDCFSLKAGLITSLTQDGADKGSYEADDRIGFEFTVQETAVRVPDPSNLFLYDYSDYIASGTYKYYITETGLDVAEVEYRPFVLRMDNGQDYSPGSTVDVPSGSTVTMNIFVQSLHSPSYSWTQTAGNTVNLSDSQSLNPTFQAPNLGMNDSPETLTFEVAATDNKGRVTVYSVSYAVQPDTVPPTVDVQNVPTSVSTSPFSATFEFSEDVIGFDITDITVSNGGASNFVSVDGNTYTADITPNGTGNLSIDIAANVAQDAASNANIAATKSIATLDATAPTVALTSNANDPHSGVFTVTATFSEAVTGFVTGDVSVGNGTASNFNDSAAPVYTFDVTPTADGAVTVDVAANVATDAATNGNAAATQLSVTTDGTATTVTLTSDATDPQSGVFTVTATFSEAVTGFDIGDITLANGTVSNFSATAASVYTFDVTPTADGAVTVDVAANVATDAATNGNAAATQLSVTTDGTAPTVTITGPTDVVTEAFTVTFTFSEGVTGFAADDVTVTNGTKGTFAGPTRGSVYTLVIAPDLGATVSVSVAANKANDPAGNGNEASNVFEVQAGSPASEFEKYREDIQQVIVDEASRSLRSSVSANRRLAQSARNRFVELRQAQEREEQVTRALIPFDVTGNFTVSGSGLNTSGNFFQQVGNEEGTYRRLFFGDFDVQHDNDTDSTTATLTGRMAWEHMTSEQTMLGYFIGGELATSTIGGSFEGDQDRLGVTAGGYVVHELSEQVYFDGFASVGAGRNNLEMANDTLALESEYTTQTATLGGAITGVYSQKGYDFKPELAFSYGKTWLGDVGFTGRAYGLVDNTLSLDAGYVSIASLTFRPEVILPIGADFVADTNTHFTYAPRLICEQIKNTTTTSDCGTGGELGFSSTSEDGLSSADMRVVLDRINGGTRSSFAFTVEHKF